MVLTVRVGFGTAIAATMMVDGVECNPPAIGAARLL